MRNKSIKKTTKTRSKTGGTQKVTPEELTKCNSMCSSVYLEKRKKSFIKTMKTNPYWMKIKSTDQQRDDHFRAKIPDFIGECKNTYCNPKCSGSTTLRYVCPACVKYDAKAKKAGAITFCRGDGTFKS